MDDSHRTVGIVGSGAFGMALGKVISDKGIPVFFWAHREEQAKKIRETHHSDYLPEDVKLTGPVRASSDLKEVVENSSELILSVPSPYLVGIVQSIVQIRKIVVDKPRIAMVTKGFLTSRDNRPALILDEVSLDLPGSYQNSLVYISGPSHAEEVAQGKVTGFVSASANRENAEIFADLLRSHSIKTFLSSDVNGVQVCAALKNIIAIAYGILDALRLENTPSVGDNTISLLLTLGLDEIERVGREFGSTDDKTFSSIVGIGDLDLTCRSDYGRNRRVGHEIVRKNILKQFSSIEDVISNLNKISYLPEGLLATWWVPYFKEQFGISLPIMEQTYKILDKKASPDSLAEVLAEM